MKRFRSMHAILLVCLVAVSALLAASCNNRRGTEKTALRDIVVIHSWDSLGEDGELFRKTMEQEFEENGVNARIHHFYANMLHRPPSVFARYDWPSMVERIRNIRPDVILLNDDPLVEAVLSGEICDTLLTRTPVVFAGVNALMRDSLKKFPLMTGLEERIDLVKNLEVVAYVTRKPMVAIELDYYRLDSMLRVQMNNILSDSVRYVNNADFHLDRPSVQWVTDNRPGKMVVHVLSAAYPYTNHAAGQSDSTGKKNTEIAYQAAKNVPQLQLKYDIFSNSFIDRCTTPQFTCIREQFNSGQRRRFLAGYFTSTEMQVHDQVDYAVRILNGEQPQLIPVANHRSGYFMDWLAMQASSPSLSYGEFANSGNIKFTIINAPFELENPLLLAAIICLIILAIVGVASTIVRMLNKWKNRSRTQLLSELTYEEKVHKLVFAKQNDTVWHIHDGMFTVEPHFAEYFKLPDATFDFQFARSTIHPDSLPAFEMLAKWKEMRGRKALRMQMSADGGKEWHWAELKFTVTDEAVARGEMYGVLFNIDEKKAMEDQLEQAQILSSEVALKENFLANISHDLKTPLGAVTGFSELLTMPDMQLSDEERAEYCEYIHQNTEMILSMIDDVMRKATSEDSDLEILTKPVEMNVLINDVYQTNRILTPSHLLLELDIENDGCMVNIDVIRIKQVINNFLSNAFKFTHHGCVTLGWKHVGNDMVEVFVQDTGIGVSEDDQKTLFDRYKKVNETDRGTGLGLNISKTIVEKHGGSIGVDSALGKGSRFFFRLKRFVQCLLLIFTLAAGLLTTQSCTLLNPPRRDAKVVVLHSYGEDYYAYSKFDNEIRQELVRQGINPTVRNIYLGMEREYGKMTKERYLHIVDSMCASGWNADVLLCEGDKAASFMLNLADTAFAFKEAVVIPIVLGAVQHPDWEAIRRAPNLVCIHDPVDYVANINMAVQMSGKNAVEIELDYGHIDSLIRDELRQSISRPPFVDNSDHHLYDLRDEVFSTTYRDSVVVLPYSVDRPDRNVYGDEQLPEMGYSRLAVLLTHSWLYPSLSVKYDTYSNTIIDKTGRPQFSAIRDGFADGSGRFICGYFAGYTTVARDIAQAGAKVLNGTTPSELVGLKHHKDYYMDYDAMRALGMKYDEYADRFVIVGAPRNETSPIAYYSVFVFSIFVVITAIWAAMVIAQSMKEQDMTTLFEDIKQRAEIRKMALDSTDTRNVRNEQMVEHVISCVHPEHEAETHQIRQAVNIPGVHTFDVYADIDGDSTYHWWQLRFGVMFDTHGKHLDGILFKIDSDKKREADMKLAIELAEEAKQKEDFLTTISHELRTPLNAVVGFSDVVASLPREQISDEEMASFGKIIMSNNNMLKDMIEDILMFSRIESHRIQYVNKDFYVKGLIEELVAEWTPRMPEGLQVHAFCLEPEIVMYNDRARVKYVLNQMINNAVKFTNNGTILLGVMYHYNEDEAEFVVGDTGIGISLEKQRMMFNLFWKDNEFIPGLGLGLHVAQKLADGMNLKVRVESKQGYGTKMHLIGKAELRVGEKREYATPQLS